MCLCWYQFLAFYFAYKINQLFIGNHGMKVITDVPSKITDKINQYVYSLRMEPVALAMPVMLY